MVLHCLQSLFKLVLHVSYGSLPHIRLLFFDGFAQLLIGKKADELVAKIAEDDPSTIPIAISSFIGKTMLFKVSITNDNLKSSKSAYVVEKFWEKEDMVVQFVKESYANADVNPQILEITDENDESSSAESASSPSKKRTSRKSGDSANSHIMITRKWIKTEKLA
ncbi:uncharacterized protein LOC111828980 [Capsella rubella]|uniref:uncharacterized protein LOC111828980 n=1 Tax=Capsella rubella TaxID=81985 RepID=UPI000CD50A2D|nr:uncharacterized protein LOC111828980 [Capsella rubella]